MTEAELQKLIQYEWTKRSLGRLFRNNVATAWTGQRYTVPHTQSIVVTPSDVLLRNARPLHAGLCVGSSDLIGWKSLTVTQDMVDQRIAIFSAVEVKSKYGRPSTEQEQFVHVVNEHGGYSVIAKKLEDVFD